ncbi:hypothetical protein [Sphingomonas sp.]|uniref:hypothetical protein n=1 Tax=Sphingomonas sp. TaxID=28214 RepID=UPI003B0068D0
MRRRFRHFACIDWSGEAVARPRGIALACCGEGDEAPVLVRPDGGWSRKAVLAWLLDHAGTQRDILIGIDASLALPFADLGAYFPGWDETPADARSLWGLVDRCCAGDAHLGASGVVDHVEAHRHFRRHGGRAGDLFGAGLGRLRVTERACRDAGLGAAQSAFNLVGPAQVGKSSLTAMRMLHLLSGRVAVWPFDAVPTRGPLFVEIYTAIAAKAAGPGRAGKIRDAATLDRALVALGSRPHAVLPRYDDHSTDAMVGAAWLRRAASDERLWRRKTDPRAALEGWTFGVP